MDPRDYGHKVVMVDWTGGCQRNYGYKVAMVDWTGGFHIDYNHKVVMVDYTVFLHWNYSHKVVIVDWTSGFHREDSHRVGMADWTGKIPRASLLSTSSGRLDWQIPQRGLSPSCNHGWTDRFQRENFHQVLMVGQTEFSLCSREHDWSRKWERGKISEK